MGQQVFTGSPGTWKPYSPESSLCSPHLSAEIQPGGVGFSLNSPLESFGALTPGSWRRALRDSPTALRPSLLLLCPHGGTYRALLF